MFTNTKIHIYLIVLSIVGIYFLYNTQHWHCTLSPHIQPLHSYDNLQLSYDADTLITFDIDDTLIMTADPMQFSYNFSNVPFSAKMYALFRYPSLIMHYEYATSLVFAQSPQKITEPTVIFMIDKMKQRCTVLGLTSMESCHWGIIESMPEWRYKMLSSMGIIFSDIPDQIFDTLPKRRETCPIFYKGILCTNQEPKGVVLGAYIDQLVIKPTQVISFDDDYNALCSIEQVCKKRGIAFQGYHYLYVTRQKSMLTFNESLKLLDGFMHIYTQNMP